jgi:uncharacterized membrane protein
MTPLVAILVAFHLIGMALVVGTFFAQMRSKDRFSTEVMLAGAIIQVLSGGLLAWLSISGGTGDHIKLAVHGTLGVVILVAAIIAQMRKRGHGRIQPWFHTAGGLGVINLLIAVFWRQYS